VSFGKVSTSCWAIETALGPANVADHEPAPLELDGLHATRTDVIRPNGPDAEGQRRRVTRMPGSGLSIM
jgi:hypothetical protein